MEDAIEQRQQLEGDSLTLNIHAIQLHAGSAEEMFFQNLLGERYIEFGKGGDAVDRQARGIPQIEGDRLDLVGARHGHHDDGFAGVGAIPRNDIQKIDDADADAIRAVFAYRAMWVAASSSFSLSFHVNLQSVGGPSSRR